jgi:hypothetical protein
VKAPRTWPKSSLSTSDGEIAPQSKTITGPSARLLRWMSSVATSY